MRHIKNQHREAIKAENTDEANAIVRSHIHDLIEGLRVRYTSSDLTSLMVASRDKNGELLVNNAGTLEDMRDSTHAAVASFIVEAGHIARTQSVGGAFLLAELIQLVACVGKTCMEQALKGSNAHGPLDLVSLQYAAVDAAVRTPLASLANLMTKMIETPESEGAPAAQSNTPADLQGMPPAGDA